jgi:hypothetical protein
MSYVVSGLPLEPFRPLFGLGEAELATYGAIRVTASDDGKYPCRVTLKDAAPGESLLLLNYEHQSAPTPYGSRHAVFVREAARETSRWTNRMPEILTTRRLIALRAFDAAGMMVDADIVAGAEVEATAVRMLTDSEVAYLHAHNPARGCYAARIDRG